MTDADAVNNRTAGPAEERVDRMMDAATRTTERADRTNLKRRRSAGSAGR